MHGRRIGADRVGAARDGHAVNAGQWTDGRELSAQGATLPVPIHHP